MSRMCYIIHAVTLVCCPELLTSGAILTGGAVAGGGTTRVNASGTETNICGCENGDAIHEDKFLTIKKDMPI